MLQTTSSLLSKSAASTLQRAKFRYQQKEKAKKWTADHHMELLPSVINCNAGRWSFTISTVILSTTSLQMSSSKLVEEPEDIQPNVQDTESGWHHDSSTVMPSQFGFSEMSLFLASDWLHEAEKLAWCGPCSKTCDLLQLQDALYAVWLLIRRRLLTIIDSMNTNYKFLDD